MSLINDALKKARQAQVTAPARESAPQLRSPDSDHPVRAGTTWMLPVVFVALGLMGATLVWMAMSNKQAEAKVGSAVGQKPLPAVAPTVAPTAASRPAPPASAPPTPVTPVAGPAVPAVVAGTPEVTESKPAPVAAPIPCELPRLNGIFYNPTKPTAIVNNKLVSPGSRIGEYTVQFITQSSVAIVGGGQTNVLSLSE